MYKQYNANSVVRDSDTKLGLLQKPTISISNDVKCPIFSEIWYSETNTYSRTRAKLGIAFEILIWE